MTEDIPFMERPSWMRPDGKPMYKVFCPVAPAEKKKRLSQAANIRRSQGALEDVEEGGRKNTIRSALELQFDWPLHQMTGYTRRLDGEGGVTRKGYKRMDPLAPDGEPTHAVDGSQTPYFGFWFYVAWYEVIVPVMTKSFGQVLNVRDKEDLETLLAAKVMM